MRGGDSDGTEETTHSESTQNTQRKGDVESGLSQRLQPEPEPELEKTMPPWKKGAQQMYEAAAARKKVAMEVGAKEPGR